MRCVIAAALAMYITTFAGVYFGAHAMDWLIQRSAAEHAACVARAGVLHRDSRECP